MSEATPDPSISESEPVRPAEGAPPRRRHRAIDPAVAARNLPRGDLSPLQRSFRHWFARAAAGLLMKTWFRVELVGSERLVDGPAVYCFNHLNWMDPILLLATFPSRPRLHFYGPKEENLHTGGRNRFMWWTGLPVPFSPLKDDLLTSVRWAQAVFDTGGVLAISGEGAIHIHEGDLLAFQEGVAYLALRAGVPIVPVAITGTSWARFRGRARVRIGDPIETGERATREAIASYTGQTWHALRGMVDGDRDLPVPSRIERWFTDLFNDWGEGGRPAATLRRGPDPADVPNAPVARRLRASCDA